MADADGTAVVGRRLGRLEEEMGRGGECMGLQGPRGTPTQPEEEMRGFGEP